MWKLIPNHIRIPFFGGLIALGYPIGGFCLGRLIGNPSSGELVGSGFLLVSLGWPMVLMHHAMLWSWGARALTDLAAEVARLRAIGAKLRPNTLLLSSAEVAELEIDLRRQHGDGEQVEVVFLEVELPEGQPLGALRAYPIGFSRFWFVLPRRASMRPRHLFELLHELGHMVGRGESVNSQSALFRLLLNYIPIFVLCGFDFRACVVLALCFGFNFFIESARIANEFAADLWAYSKLSRWHGHDFAEQATRDVIEILEMEAKGSVDAEQRAEALKRLLQASRNRRDLLLQRPDGKLPTVERMWSFPIFLTRLGSGIYAGFRAADHPGFGVGVFAVGIILGMAYWSFRSNRSWIKSRQDLDYNLAKSAEAGAIVPVGVASEAG